MSVVVNIYYTGTNGNAGKFAEEMENSGTAAAIRKEAGNLRYDYFSPMTDPETVLLIDCWKDQRALDRHHASPMMEKMRCMKMVGSDEMMALTTMRMSVSVIILG